MLQVALLAFGLLHLPQDPRNCASAIGADEAFQEACAAAIAEYEEALGGYDENGVWDPMYNAVVDSNGAVVPRSVRRTPVRRPASPGFGEITAEELALSPDEFLRRRGVTIPEGAPPPSPGRSVPGWVAVAFSPEGFGAAGQAASQSEAEQRALSDCRKRTGSACALEDVIAMQDACMSVARGASGIGFGVAEARRPSEDAAVADCSERDSGCRVVFSDCG